MTQQYCEFCCKLNGSNFNAGTLNGDLTEPGTVAAFTYASGTWVAATGVFTVASGNPAADGVAVGNWASVFPDSATIATGFIARVTARDATSITVIVTPGNGCCGTVPSNGTNNVTLKIGGAWKGPNGTSGFPLDFGTGAGNAQQKQFLRDATGRFPRINLKNNQVYNITNASRGGSPADDGILIPQNSDKMCTFQGYTSAYGDFGLAIFDGGAVGTNYTVVRYVNPSNCFMKDIIVQNNGDTGLIHHVDLVMGGGGDLNFVRCVGRHSWSRGLAEYNMAVECETYDTQQYAVVQHEGVGGGGFDRGGCFRCIMHDQSDPATILNTAIAYHLMTGTACCIASKSVGYGLQSGINLNGDVYKCGQATGDGAGSTGISLEQGSSLGVDCNAIECTAAGYSLTTPYSESITNRYGTGSAANASISDGSAYYNDLSGYPANVNPWRNPAAGDFSIVLTEARNTGRGEFTQTAPGYAGTRGYPDLGAADFPSIGMFSPPGMSGGM